MTLCIHVHGNCNPKPESKLTRPVLEPSIPWYLELQSLLEGNSVATFFPDIMRSQNASVELAPGKSKERPTIAISAEPSPSSWPGERWTEAEAVGADWTMVEIPGCNIYNPPQYSSTSERMTAIFRTFQYRQCVMVNQFKRHSAGRL